MNNKTLLILRCFVALAGVCALIAGILQGDAADTLRKAITICLECIGIG